jgi:hypothetical protein
VIESVLVAGDRFRSGGGLVSRNSIKWREIRNAEGFALQGCIAGCGPFRKRLDHRQYGKALMRKRNAQYALRFRSTSKHVLINIWTSSQRLQLLMYHRSSFTRSEICSIDGVAPRAPLH